jgi:hypothetical protein
VAGATLSGMMRSGGVAMAVVASRNGRDADHEWACLRDEWVSGSYSLRAFAGQRGLSYSALLRRAHREHWQQLRSLAVDKNLTRQRLRDLAAARLGAQSAIAALGRLLADSRAPLPTLASAAHASARASSALATAAHWAQPHE